MLLNKIMIIDKIAVRIKMILLARAPFILHYTLALCFSENNVLRLLNMANLFRIRQ
ncbi:MAG: hypothetical protein QXN75_05610 [Thermoproteota archaeon]|nr:hypothetical protein [Candidatus Brockarchaeota archaeon]